MLIRSTRRFRAVSVAVLVGALATVGLAAPASAEHLDCAVSVGDVSVAEGNSGTATATFTITATSTENHALCNNVKVEYLTTDQTAVAGADYIGVSGSVTFTAPGTKAVDVTVNGDTAVEGDETFTMNIMSSSAKTIITDPEGIGTIRDDDSDTPAPTVTADDPSVVEGDAGTRSGVFTLRLSRAASAEVSVTWTIEDATAKAATDYTADASGTAKIAAGQTTVTVPFTVKGDTDDEANETFVLKIGTVTGGSATKGDDEGVATIVDDDPDQMTGGNGYRMVAADGGIFTFGFRNFHGSTGSMVLNKPIVGGATDLSDYDGYWIVASDGGVFTFNAEFHGSLGGTAITSPAVEIEPTPTGKGYWIVQANGKVTPFGDAKHHGDMATKGLNKPVIGMSVTPSGLGYWLVAEDGGIFSFGDADFFGSMGNKPLNAPVIDLAPMPDGEGYYLVAKDGGVFTFGTALFKGSTGSMKLNQPVIAMLVNPVGSGYWLAASDGGIFTFGNVDFLGSMGATKLNAPVLDLIN